MSSSRSNTTYLRLLLLLLFLCFRDLSVSLRGPIGVLLRLCSPEIGNREKDIRCCWMLRGFFLAYFALAWALDSFFLFRASTALLFSPDFLSLPMLGPCPCSKGAYRTEVIRLVDRFQIESHRFSFFFLSFVETRKRKPLEDHNLTSQNWRQEKRERERRENGSLSFVAFSQSLLFSLTLFQSSLSRSSFFLINISKRKSRALELCREKNSLASAARRRAPRRERERERERERRWRMQRGKRSREGEILFEGTARSWGDRER